MSRARAVLASLRLLNSVPRTHLSAATYSFLTQVSHSSSLLKNCSIPLHFGSNNQRLFFSSKPCSVLDLLLLNGWSVELESELEKFGSALNHEMLMYVFTKLDQYPRKAFDFYNWVNEKSWFKPSSAMYSLLLRIFSNKESMKEFWITLRKMKEQGFYLEEPTYVTVLGEFKKNKMAAEVAALTHFYKRMIEENGKDAVVKDVVSVVLRKKEWCNEVENELSEMKIPLSDNLVIRVLRELRFHPAKALKIFKWAGACPNYAHSTVTYNAVARILARDGSNGEFWSMVKEMKDAGHEMDTDTYIKIVRQFQKSKMMEDAVKLYEFMMDGPFKPSEQECGILLRSLSSCDKPNLDLVFRVARKYESLGNSLSKRVYDGIHRALTNAGCFDDAEKIVQDMKDAGHTPDNITYSQLIFGLCRLRKLDEASRVLDNMEGNDCIPDIKTWTILIQGYCDAGEVEKAVILYAKMVERNIDADADLLDVLISGFLSKNRIDGAYDLTVELVNRTRLVPWQATYKLLIDKLLGVRMLEEAMNLLSLMKKQNYPPFPEPFVKYISKFGSVADAVEFLKALTVKEYPSISAYSHILGSFFKEGRHSEAKDLLFQCPHHIRGHPRIRELFGTAKGT